MSIWSSGLNLSDLAADHLKSAGVNPFSFLPKHQVENSNATSRSTPFGKVTSNNQSKPSVDIQFDEFNEFFTNEDNELEDDFMIEDCMVDEDPILKEVAPSAFGYVICGEFKQSLKTPSHAAVNHVILSLHHKCFKPLCANSKTVSQKPKKTEIIPFDFSTPSPDDIIIEKQKQAL